MNGLAVAADLVGVGGLPSRQAGPEILRVLCSAYDLRGGTLFSHDSWSNRLILRAQQGFGASIWPSFQLPMATPTGQTVVSGSTVALEDVATCQNFIAPKTIRDFDLKHYLSLPLLVPNGGPSDDGALNHSAPLPPAVGAISLYPADRETWSRLRQDAEHLARVASATYGASVLRDLHAFRADLLRHALASADDHSFFHRILQTLTARWSFEAASLFIVDERNGHLYLRATTGLDQARSEAFRGRSAPRRRREIFYRQDETNRTTVRALKSGIPAVVLDSKELGAGKFVERVAGARRATAFLPVFLPHARGVSTQPALGVLRVANATVRLHTRSEVTGFGWEDLQLLSFATDLIGVILRLTDRATRVLRNFNRTLHGFRNSVSSVLAVLYQLEELAPPSDADLEHHIPDGISHLQNLLWQMDRFEAGEDDLSTLEEVRLYAEVLAPAKDFAEHLRASLSVRRLRFVSWGQIDARTVPLVSSNREGLLLVFRNLFENAMKYRSSRDSCEIRIELSSDDHFVEVSVKDSGIGIPDDERPHVFLDGFRGRAAYASDISGTGIGLAQCREVLGDLGGSIELMDGNEGTTFAVRVPIAKQHVA